MPEPKSIQSVSVLQALGEVPLYGVILLDLAGKVQSWNAGVTQLLQYGAEEAVDNHYEFIFTPEDRAIDAPGKEMETALSTGCAHDDRWHLRKDLSRVYVNGALALIKSSKGEALGFIKILRDETQKAERIERIESLNRKLGEAHQTLHEHAGELENRVAERTSQLNERNTELEAFCYSVAHDLRAPLRSIQAMSQVVIEDFGEKLDPTCLDYVNRIARAGARLDRLTLDLLKYSRLSREEIQMGTVSLDEAIKEVLGLVQETIVAKQAEIKISGPLPDVQGQRDYLVQILLNFTSNALKFVAEGVKPVVEIWPELQENRVRLFVRDNGIGVAEEYREKIFHLFERLHPDGTFEGTGVGLAIAYKAASRLHATIGVSTTSEKGSTFWIDLPLAT